MPCIGFWEWNIKERTELISKSLLDFFDLSLATPTEEGMFWSRVMDDAKYLSFNRLRHAASQKRTESSSAVFDVHLSGREFSTEHKMEVIEWGDNGDALRMVGLVSIVEKGSKIEDHHYIIALQNQRLVDFADIVSHNLRSHSSNLEMMIQLYDESESEKEKQEVLGHIKTIAERLSETIVNLNEAIKVQSSPTPQKEIVNLHDTIERATQSLADMLSSKKALVTNKVSPEISLYYNLNYLESILLNLVSNAIKFSHPGRVPEITITVSNWKEFFVMEVADNGLGIDLSRHQHKLFGMHKTFHDVEEARGVGLFITKNQVEAMGGKIEVESEEGNGSVFKVYFPRSNG